MQQRESTDKEFGTFLQDVSVCACERDSRFPSLFSPFSCLSSNALVFVLGRLLQELFSTTTCSGETGSGKEQNKSKNKKK